MNLADAIKKIKDTINAGVKPAENSFEDAVITVVENTGSGGSGGGGVITLYGLSNAYDPSSDDTLPSGTWLPSETTHELSRTDGGDALKCAELLEIFSEYELVLVVLPTTDTKLLPTSIDYYVDETEEITACVNLIIESEKTMFGIRITKNA